MGTAPQCAALVGPGAVPPGEGAAVDRVVIVTSTVRRRSRQAASRPKVVQFSLTEEEFDEVSGAVARSGLTSTPVVSRSSQHPRRRPDPPAPRMPIRAQLTQPCWRWSGRAGGYC
jgi:hypothetical protein